MEETKKKKGLSDEAWEAKYRGWMKAREDKKREAEERREQELKEECQPFQATKADHSEDGGSTQKTRDGSIFERLDREAKELRAKREAMKKEKDAQEEADLQGTLARKKSTKAAIMERTNAWFEWQGELDRNVEGLREQKQEAEEMEASKLTFTPMVLDLSREITRRKAAETGMALPAHERLFGLAKRRLSAPVAVADAAASRQRRDSVPEAVAIEGSVYDRLYRDASRSLRERNARQREQWQGSTTVEVMPVGFRRDGLSPRPHTTDAGRKQAPLMTM